jgi:hypothetical protein
MNGSDAQDAMRARIESDIASFGHHITLVRGGKVPRFAYTIGLARLAGNEVVLAGATTLSARDVKRTTNAAADVVRTGAAMPDATFEVDNIGTFRLGPVDGSWIRLLLRGATSFYHDRIAALQIVPDDSERTIDVPDMSRAYDEAHEPVWRWLTAPWPFEIAPSSAAVTNIEALRGRPITEVARWEQDQWEMFAGAGPDVRPEDVRAVPIATLLGFDESAWPVVKIEVGAGLWREPRGAWQAWGKPPSAGDA